MSLNQLISSFRSMFFPRETLVTWSVEKEVNQTKAYVTRSKMAVANSTVPSKTWLFLQWRQIKNQVYLSRLQVRPNINQISCKTFDFNVDFKVKLNILLSINRPFTVNQDFVVAVPSIIEMKFSSLEFQVQIQAPQMQPPKKIIIM